LDLRNLNLFGSFNLIGFNRGLKLYVAGNPQLNFCLAFLPNLTIVYKDSQEELNRIYPNKNRVEVIDLKKLDNLVFDEQFDELIVDGYPRLKEMKRENKFNNISIAKLAINDCPELKVVGICGLRKNQELIINNCFNLENLDCGGNNLPSLDLNDFPQLKKLCCYNNKLTKLDLTNCSNLQSIDCSNNFLIEIILPSTVKEKLEILHLENNKLTELNIDGFSNLQIISCQNNFLTSLDLNQKTKLEHLNISDNYFSKQDLSFLSHLVGLKYLNLGNNKQEKVQQGIYNRFVGSLEFLRNMSKLGRLSIENTDFDEGVEYLPDSLFIEISTQLSYSTQLRPKSKIGKIKHLLDNAKNFRK